MLKNHLIAFAKNPILGKVKTRLAVTVGNEKALEIYQDLLSYTCDISSQAVGEKTVFYSDFVEKDDCWNNKNFSQAVQKGNDLGERMSNAFKETFKTGDAKVVLIGTDCKEISTADINKAFDALEFVDVVIGPAVDGGYYLIGIKKLQENLFKNITWSTDTVLEETVSKINTQKLSFLLLKTLSDIDTEKDLI